MSSAVLIVDDNPTNLKLARIVLEDAELTVVTADGAAAALRILETTPISIILMDLQMPEVGGLELTRQLRGDPRWARIKIIALTAAAMTGDEQKARDAGCDGYITKPIDTESLPRVVRSFLTE